MITYYKDRDVLVTSTGVRMGGRAYRLGDFAQVWHSRGRALLGPAGRAAAPSASPSLTPIVIGALGILVALAHRRLHRHDDRPDRRRRAGRPGRRAAGRRAAELVDRSYDRGSRDLEIWARVRGADVLLLRTDNAQRFGQIYRALQRALEGGPVPR